MPHAIRRSSVKGIIPCYFRSPFSLNPKKERDGYIRPALMTFGSAPYGETSRRNPALPDSGVFV